MLLLLLRRRWVLPSSISRCSSSSSKLKLLFPFPLPIIIDRPPFALVVVIESAAAAMEAMLVLAVRGAWCLLVLLMAVLLVWRGTGTTPTPTPSAASLAPVVSNTRFGQKSIQLSEVARYMQLKNILQKQGKVGMGGIVHMMFFNSSIADFSRRCRSESRVCVSSPCTSV